MEEPKYHKKNPHVYRAFKRAAKMMIKRGYKRYSAKGIYEMIRGMIDTSNFRTVDNDYTPFYARKFMIENPEYKGFFELRSSKFDLKKD